MKFGEWAKAVAGTTREHLGVAAVSVGVVIAMALVAAGSFNGCEKQGTVNAADTVATFPVKAATVTPIPASQSTAKPKPPPEDAIIVYVTGAVKRPGVYTLASDARLYHAIRAAGGFKTNAVTDALNLADRAQDGDQLCIPSRKPARAMATNLRAVSPAPERMQAAASPPLIRKTLLPALVVLPPAVSPDDTTPTVTVVPTPPAPGRVLGIPIATATNEPVADPTAPVPAFSHQTPATGVITLPTTSRKPQRTAAKTSTKFKNPGDGIVHINSATAAELEQLPRCGPAMSAKILAYRAQIGGRFTDTKQLMDVKGCGEKTYEKWLPFLAL